MSHFLRDRVSSEGPAAETTGQYINSVSCIGIGLSNWSEIRFIANCGIKLGRWRVISCRRGPEVEVARRPRMKRTFFSTWDNEMWCTWDYERYRLYSALTTSPWATIDAEYFIWSGGSSVVLYSMFTGHFTAVGLRAAKVYSIILE